MRADDSEFLAVARINPMQLENGPGRESFARAASGACRSFKQAQNRPRQPSTKPSGWCRATPARGVGVPESLPELDSAK